MELVFNICQDKTAVPTKVAIEHCIVAGWAGRDAAQIQAHIDELALLGVAPPSAVPLYYRVAINQLTQDTSVQVVGGDTSGEAEVLYFVVGDEPFVSLASDHTDRRLESHSVALSKQVCIKPVASEAWRFAEVEPHWDQLILRSWIEEDGSQVLYQEDTLAALLPPRELAGKHFGSDVPPQGYAMMCGTVPVIGDIRPSTAFTMELADPVLRRSLTHRYTVQSLAMVS